MWARPTTSWCSVMCRLSGGCSHSEPDHASTLHPGPRIIDTTVSRVKRQKQAKNGRKAWSTATGSTRASSALPHVQSLPRFQPDDEQVARGCAHLVGVASVAGVRLLDVVGGLRQVRGEVGIAEEDPATTHSADQPGQPGGKGGRIGLACQSALAIQYNHGQRRKENWTRNSAGQWSTRTYMNARKFEAGSPVDLSRHSGLLRCRPLQRPSSDRKRSSSPRLVK